MIEEPRNYVNFKEFLEAVFHHRMERNQYYSMRQLSKSLDVDHSSLSRMLSGSRTISGKNIEKFGLKLGISLDDIIYFKEQNDKKNKVKKKDYRSEYTQVVLDHFNFISEWQHLAILQLLKLKTFKPSYVWVSQVLGISMESTRSSIERLERIGFLKIEDNVWTDTTKGKISIQKDEHTTTSIKKYQTELLNMAQDALHMIDIAKRDQSSMVMTIKKKDIKQAKKMLKDFRIEFTKFLERHEDPDEVYQLVTSFFPLTNDI